MMRSRWGSAAAMWFLPIFVLAACGGHTRKDVEALGGAPASAGAPAAMQPDTGHEPLRIGIPPNEEQPPFQTPPWLGTNWSDNIDRPVAGVCDEGWTAEQAIEALQREFSEVAGTLVAPSEFLETIESFRDPTARRSAPRQRVISVFLMESGDVGAVTLMAADFGMAFYYYLLSRDCEPIRLGNFIELDAGRGCDRYRGKPLWNIPELPDVRECEPTGGFYTFDGQVTTDTCQRSPPTFTGLFHYTQLDAASAELYFLDIPLAELTVSTIRLRIMNDHAAAAFSEDGPCGHGVTELMLEHGSSVSIRDERDPCPQQPATICTWAMQSERVYGPLN